MKKPLDRTLAEDIELGSEQDLPAPDTDVPMVSRSLRLPLATFDSQQIAAAQRSGVPLLDLSSL